MPHPPAYTGSQDNDQTRSVDIVHIEPSIREGVHLIPSLYGPEASRPLYRFAPVNVVQPFLTGSGVIPGRVVCEVGTWEASPTADYYYQWMADGVDIPGANAYEIFTDETFDGVTLTCEVRGDNGIGESYAISSNSVLCTLIEPIELREAEFFGITGLRANKLQTTFSYNTMFMTGIGTDDRLDTMRAVAYFTTGIGADDRHDVNAMNIPVITGLSVTDTLSVLERDLGIAVIWNDIGEPLIESVPQPLAMRNQNAELGVFGWDIFGSATYVQQENGAIDPIEGNLSFYGGFNVHPAGSNTPYTSLSQDVYLWDVWHADIDAGLCSIETYWQQGSSTSESDMANIRFEFYAADGTTLLGFNDGAGLFKTPVNIFFARSSDTPIPSGTRFVRLIQEYLWDGSGDNNINAQIDWITSFIRKGPKLNTRNFGPTFDSWRIRFLSANSWSGGALSEAEFLDTPAGTDLATGGSILFGSAGFGVVNADGAFDDTNATYWAGAENSIAEGSSWIGYNKALPWKPQAISLTARPGSAAFQMPTSFIVEGSDDGIRWTEVEFFDTTRVARNWDSAERRVFNIGHGTQPYVFEAPFSVPTFGFSLFDVDDTNFKANVYRSFSRMNVERFKLGIMNESHDYDWIVAKVNDQKSSYWYFGMVSEVHETGSASYDDGGTPSTTTVQIEHVLSSPLILEPGDYFVIGYWDKNLAGNPNIVSGNPNQGRLNWINNWNGDPLNTRIQHSRWVNGWQANISALPEIGYTNNGPYTASSGYVWAIDFQASFF